MRRREFLLAAGAGTVGTVAGLSTVGAAVRVRWWATRRAIAHEGLRERVTGYLGLAFDAVDRPVEISHGGVVETTTEDAYRLVVDEEWPGRLLGTATDDGPGPVAGVNLLVTDGSMLDPPTGAGLPSVAAVGGARYLGRLPPPATMPSVVPDSLPMRTVQILVHEVGHGLGLEHDHGTIHADDAAAVVSPMVSGYAWADGVGRTFDYERDRCGRRYPSVVGRNPWLRLSFDGCERRAILRYGRLDAPLRFPSSFGPAGVDRVCPGPTCEGFRATDDPAPEGREARSGSWRPPDGASETPPRALTRR